MNVNSITWSKSRHACLLYALLSTGCAGPEMDAGNIHQGVLAASEADTTVEPPAEADEASDDSGQSVQDVAEASGPTDDSGQSEQDVSAERGASEVLVDDSVQPEPDLAANLSSNEPSSCVSPNGARTFQQCKEPATALSPEGLPRFTTAQLDNAFGAIRDTPILTMSGHPEFPRRITWLLPDNGCASRARASIYYLKQLGYPAPYFMRVQAKKGKLLSLKTDNDPRGVVSWGGHVAPAVRVDDTIMVLDPAIDPLGPMPVLRWLGLQTTSLSDVDVALCRDYADDSGCFAETPLEPQLENFEPYLQAEWRGLEMLGRDPFQSLGECPPWVSCDRTEPYPDPNQPPTLHKVLSDLYSDSVTAGLPIYVIGDNFVNGLTTVHILGNAMDRWATIDHVKTRSMLVNEEYPSGDYQMTAFNGSLSSETLTLHFE